MLPRDAAELGRHVASSSVGASYRVDDQWKFAVGVAYDQTPVNDATRTPRLPDSDRWWLAIGGEYKWTPNLKFDAGFVVHLRRQPERSTRTPAARRKRPDQRKLRREHAIFSLQATYTF